MLIRLDPHCFQNIAHDYSHLIRPFLRLMLMIFRFCYVTDNWLFRRVYLILRRKILNEYKFHVVR